jgi:hypothetical protein
VGAAATEEVRKRMIQTYQRRGYGPARVATNVLKAVARNRAVAPITPEAWVMYYAKRFVPGLWARVNAALSRRQQRQLGIED